MSATLSLLLATIAFVGTHLALSHPLRTGLVQNLGEQRFTLLYSAVAALTLGWMVFAWDGADGTPLPLGSKPWIAPSKGWAAALVVMLLASILLIGSFVRNPAFPHPGAGPRPPRPATGVFAITRHPMNWSFILWALVHIALWGSPRNLIVAGGILVLALAGSIGQDRKKRATLGQSWRDWEARTSFVPFVALFSGRASWRAAWPGWIALLGGLVFWLAVTWYHAPAVSPIVALTD